MSEENGEPKREVCGRCYWFELIAGGRGGGYCWHDTPRIHPGGFTARPTVGPNDRSCAFFTLKRQVTLEEAKADAQRTAKALLDSGAIRVTTKPPPKYAPEGKRAEGHY